MEENKKSGKKKLVILLLLLLFLLLMFYLLFRFIFSKPAKLNLSPTKSVSVETQVSDDKPSEPEEIIKCQSVVVAPKTTIELFTYTSGKKILADYRIGATTNEDSFKIQILYDGEWVYLWKPPINFGQEPKPENPPGLKMKIQDFNYDVNLTEIGSVERFGKSPLSGDHVCNQWDGLDSVFDEILILE